MTTVKRADLVKALTAINDTNLSHWAWVYFNKKEVVFTVTQLFCSWEFKVESCNDINSSEEHPWLCVPIGGLAGLRDELESINDNEVTIQPYDYIHLDVQWRDGEISWVVMSYNIGCYSSFPEMPIEGKSKQQGQVCITKQNLEAVEHCEQYTCKRERLPILAVINIRVENGNRVIAEATNGYHLIQVDFPGKSQTSFNFVLHSCVPAMLLRQKWKEFTFILYEDRVVVTDETGNLKFQTFILQEKYPLLDIEIEKTTSSAVESIIKTQDFMSFVLEDRYASWWESVTLICKEKTIQICAFEYDNRKCKVHAASVHRSGDHYFTWNNFSSETLAKALAPVSRDVKEMVIYMSNSTTEQPPLVVKYSKNDWSFVIGVAQTAFREGTPLWNAHQRSLKRYAPKKQSKRNRLNSD